MKMKIKIEWSRGSDDAEARSFVFDLDEARAGLALLPLKSVVGHFRYLERLPEGQFCPEANRTLPPEAEMITVEAGE